MLFAPFKRLPKRGVVKIHILEADRRSVPWHDVPVNVGIWATVFQWWIRLKASVGPIALVLHVYEQRSESPLEGGFDSLHHSLKIRGFLSRQVSHTGRVSAR